MSVTSPIGQRLRSAREEKRASRVDVSQETKIAVHHIAALEYSDFKELPDVVHVKGYVRAYAEYLGLEPADVLQEFLEEYEAQHPVRDEDPRDEVVRKMSKMLGGSEDNWARRLRPVFAVAALALVATLVWMGWRWLAPAGDADVDAATAAVVRSESSETQEQAPQEFVVIREPEEATRAAPTPGETTPPVEAATPGETATPSKTTPPGETATPAKKTPPGEAVIDTRTESDTPVETAAPVTPTEAAATRLSITQYGVGTSVESRQLQGESDRFALGTKVAFFTRVEGGRAGDTIRHVWRHEGNEIASIPLRIGSANWRTYSNKTMHAGSAGTWTVEAVDESGTVLARSEFNCTR